jgi:hypothetical protein
MVSFSGSSRPKQARLADRFDVRKTLGISLGREMLSLVLLKESAGKAFQDKDIYAFYDDSGCSTAFLHCDQNLQYWTFVSPYDKHPNSFCIIFRLCIGGCQRNVPSVDENVCLPIKGPYPSAWRSQRLIHWRYHPLRNGILSNDQPIVSVQRLG